MKFQFIHRKWFQLLIVGTLLFIATEQGLQLTGNLNFFPTVILLGAFTIPVAFVTYFYEYVRDRDVSMPLLTTCFFFGGVLGLLAAGTLEFGTLRNAGILGIFGVGLIEEAAKLILPVALYIRWRHRHEADGLLFGVAAGMGFAALETMGYGLVAFLQSQGDVGITQQILLIRGLLSPAGHAAWTGLICAVLWRERERTGRGLINMKVVGTFILVVLLHAVWDIVSSLNSLMGIFVLGIVFYLVIIAVSLTLLFRRLSESNR